jgi:hypothetical protein
MMIEGHQSTLEGPRCFLPWFCFCWKKRLTAGVFMHAHWSLNDAAWLVWEQKTLNA